jgi:cell division protein FtsB
MFRRTAATPPDDAQTPAAPEPQDETPIEPPDGTAAARPSAPDFSALPVVGITRRRVTAAIGMLLAVWIVIVFARQVGDASAATSRAEQIAIDNVSLRREISTLDRELELIGRQRYIEQQARGYGLGGRREVAFTLAQDAPALAPDAPGSASVRVGAPRAVPPLERWLTLLFGPSH